MEQYDLEKRSMLDNSRTHTCRVWTDYDLCSTQPPLLELHRTRADVPVGKKKAVCQYSQLNSGLTDLRLFANFLVSFIWFLQKVQYDSHAWLKARTC